MDIKIGRETSNPLLSRREYEVEIAHAEAPTPKREELRVRLAEVLKVPKDRLVVESLHPSFGSPLTRGIVHVYESREALEKTEREHILVRNGLREKKAASAPASTPSNPPSPPAGG
jgi:small subunit ribosomal protein S24e